MTRSFKIEIEVDEFYELEVSVPFHAFDQREGCHYTDHKKETFYFPSFNDACEWVKKNPKAEIKSFVRTENKLEALKAWTEVKSVDICSESV